MARANLTPVGEAALLLRPADPNDVPALLRSVHAAGAPNVVDAVAGADSLLVLFDEPASERERAWLSRLLDRPPASDGEPPVHPCASHRIPVVYDGPDLDLVARHAGLRPDDVIEIHAAADYRVAFVGFQPGFAYLSGLDPRLHTPRLATPRVRVEPGSLGIGGEWTGVYPSASPGGWNLVGRTEVRMFDSASPAPARLAPGDLVRFVPS